MTTALMFLTSFRMLITPGRKIMHVKLKLGRTNENDGARKIRNVGKRNNVRPNEQRQPAEKQKENGTILLPNL